MTQGSKWAHSAYFEWVGEVQLAFGPERIKKLAGRFGHVRLTVTVGSPRLSADLSNYGKAVEDALQGLAYPDDNCKYVCDTRTRADWSGHGFVAELEPCAGECNFDRRKKR
jgi:hypothetical protein